MYLGLDQAVKPMSKSRLQREVAQIFNLPDYEPWSAAESSLVTLREARREAGVG